VSASAAEVVMLRRIATALGPMEMSWSLLTEAADLELMLLYWTTS
jgi:hypothetical protein